MRNIFSKNLSAAELAAQLKGKCVDYVTTYLDDDFLHSVSGQNLIEKVQEETDGELLADEENWIRQMDSFILFGDTEDGHRVLDEIITSARLGFEERDILRQWRTQALSSIFEVNDTVPDKVNATDVLAEVGYEIHFNDPLKAVEAVKHMLSGSFVQSNVLPVREVWFFSGVQTVLPEESEAIIFETFVKNAVARQAFRNNAEKLRRAREIQKKYYRAFVDLFSTDELIVPPVQVQERMQEYYDHLVPFGLSKSGIVTAPELPQDFQQAKTIGIVMDEREGQYEFEDYGEFITIFRTGNVSKKSSTFVMTYLEDESLPAFVFKRMKERYPKQFYHVMRKAIALSGKPVDLADDFDRLMDAFKPEWRETYPAVIPLNRRFEKYYYNLGRNDPCYCGSGKKYKKCRGK